MLDERMIYTVMKEVCNFFTRRDDICRYEGEVTIKDKELNITVPSPFIIIRGSHRNDGLYYMEDEHRVRPYIFHEGDVHPVDETFTGRVWFCYPTQDFLMICEEIGKFEEQKPVIGGVVSESFGSSSRSFAQGSNGTITWRESFGNSLRPYRNHMFEEVW